MTYDMATVTQSGHSSSACKGDYMETFIHETPDHFWRCQRFRKTYQDTRSRHSGKENRAESYSAGSHMLAWHSKQFCTEFRALFHRRKNSNVPRAFPWAGIAHTLHCFL